MADNIFAFTGKGGVGKTSLSALTVRLLTERFPEKRILAIDADPAVGLATALGVNVTHSVNDVRKKFQDEFSRPGKPSAHQVMDEADYDVRESLVDCGSFCFLAIGRPEGAGCYCSVNSFLKDIITELADSFDYVVIDGEAGIEQINRRVMAKVTDLILISDSSKKGLDVIRTILNVAEGLDMYSHAHTIINRVRNEKLLELLDTDGLFMEDYITEDEELELLDIKGESLMNLSAASETVRKLSSVLDRIIE